MSSAPRLERALAALPLNHRKVVAENIGAAGPKPAAIVAVLGDEERLETLVVGLPNAARAATTELAFAAIGRWSHRASGPTERLALDVLERRGLALCFKTTWSMSYVAPADLVPALRRIRLRAHARSLPDAPAPVSSFPASEQLLDDAAVVGATIAHAGIQIKADGDVYAKARPKLAGPLGPIAEGVPDFGEHRIDLALTLLQELGALRVASDDVPGRSVRRTLELDGDLSGLLDRPFDERTRLTRLLRGTFPDLHLIDFLLDELAGRTVLIEELGRAVTRLFDEASKQLVGDRGNPMGTGLSVLRMRILAGGAVLGVDASGALTTVTFKPPPPVESDGPPCLGQADFELVAMRRLWPHERAALYLLCEPVPGREHVARLTRERIHGATKALRTRDPDAILGRLRALAGSLPQNVERAVADWVSETLPRARLRSAIVVDLGDGELGDDVARKLGELVVERLAPNLLAIAAEDLTRVASALRRAGVELDPGLDRISGAWQERSTEDDYSRWWRPSTEPVEQLSAPSGKLVSGLDPDGPPAAAPRPLTDAERIFARLAQLELGADSYEVAGPEIEIDYDDDDELEPAELLLEAYEDGCPVELRYAAAGGTVVVRGTVEQVDGARFRLDGPEAGSSRWRWLKGLLEVRRLDD